MELFCEKNNCLEQKGEMTHKQRSHIIGNSEKAFYGPKCIVRHKISDIKHLNSYLILKKKQK